MTEKINPTKQLIESAKQLNGRLASQLHKVKSMNKDDPEFEGALKTLEDLHQETDIMLKRLSVSVENYSESVREKNSHELAEENDCNRMK